MATNQANQDVMNCVTGCIFLILIQQHLTHLHACGQFSISTHLELKLKQSVTGHSWPVSSHYLVWFVLLVIHYISDVVQALFYHPKLPNPINLVLNYM